MYKSYKYRIYPNQLQEELIQKTFGCCRFVYNQVLVYRKNKYETTGEFMSKFDCDRYVTQVLKSEYPWLREVDKFALSNASFNVHNAYQRFFSGQCSFPDFKSKRNHRKSYKTNYSHNNIEVSYANNQVKLPKLKWVKVNIHRAFEGRIISATVSQNPSGKYYVSIIVETQHESLAPAEKSIGLDLGIKDLIITSDGDKYDNLCIFKNYEKKLAKEQRKLSHKVKGSNNWNKQRIKVAKVYEHIHNARLDYLHKLSHKLISENQVIVSETLQIDDMAKDNHLAKSIYDASWYELTRQLAYKAEWNGRTYIQIDPYFPSSQLCSVCGYKNPDTKNLSVREWICPKCGAKHDRDINAANNILAEGLKQID